MQTETTQHGVPSMPAREPRSDACPESNCGDFSRDSKGFEAEWDPGALSGRTVGVCVWCQGCQAKPHACWTNVLLQCSSTLCSFKQGRHSHLLIVALRFNSDRKMSNRARHGVTQHCPSPRGQREMRRTWLSSLAVLGPIFTTVARGSGSAWVSLPLWQWKLTATCFMNEHQVQAVKLADFFSLVGPCQGSKLFGVAGWGGNMRVWEAVSSWWPAG